MERNQVVIGIMVKDGKVLIIEKADGLIPWAFPGGVITSGDNLEEALANELLAATGYTIENIKNISSKDHSDFPMTITYFSCTPSDIPKSKITDPDIESCEWVDPQKLPEYFTTDIDPDILKFFTELQ